VIKKYLQDMIEHGYNVLPFYFNGENV